MTHKFLKKCSTSLAVSKMQIKTAKNYHLLLLKWVLPKRQKKMLVRIWRKVGFYSLLKGCKIAQPFWRTT
jgi:hypothetical protein